MAGHNALHFLEAVGLVWLFVGGRDLHGLRVGLGWIDAGRRIWLFRRLWEVWRGIGLLDHWGILLSA